MKDSKLNTREAVAEARQAFDGHVAACETCGDRDKPQTGFCATGESLWRTVLTRALRALDGQ